MPKATLSTIPSQPALQIGDTVYVYNNNRRVYPAGQAGSRPIYRHHWEPLQITGINRVSYILENGIKVNKKDPGPSVLLSSQALDDRVWRHANQYTIERAVTACDSADTLRAIAKLLALDLTDE